MRINFQWINIVFQDESFEVDSIQTADEDSTFHKEYDAS